MPQRPRGTRDFGPEETEVRRGVADQLRRVFDAFGYREVQTPTFEELELFAAKSGAGIVDELYAFQDKGGRDLTLRPELTAPAMRFYFAEHQFDPKPVKWYYFGNCFRYDRPQAGRYREFWQFGCELVGAGSPLAYAELVALADACLSSVGLQGYRLRVGHVGVLGHAVAGLGLDADARKDLMRRLDKGDRPGAVKLLEDAGVEPGRANGFFGALDASQAAACGIAHPGVDELSSCMALLAAMGVPAQLDLSIARGLDYYTGIVFEVHCDSLGAQSQVLGGGGYDLAGVFGAQSAPTMGFGLGFDRVVEALGAQGRAPPARPGPAVCLGAMGDRAASQVAVWANALRRRGVRVEMDLLGRRPGVVAKWASGLGASRLVILGDRDLESAEVVVKDLATGASERIPLDGVVAALS